jgi:hypothetical protein
MKPTSPLLTIILALTALALTACANKPPPVERRSKSFSGKVDDIMVIGVSENAERRFTFETSFVKALAANQTRAMPSREILTSSINLTREIVEKAIEGQQVGAVLITRIAGVKEKETYQLQDDYDYERADSGYYDIALQETNKGYYANEKLVLLETRLFDTASGKLIWSLQSGATAETEPKKIIKELIELTVTTLSKSGLIAAKP